MIFFKKIDKFTAVALFFLFLQGLQIVKFYLLDDYQLVYYFCYHAPILFAVAFYRKNILFIRTLIAIGFVGQVIWLSDYFSYICFGKFILGNSQFILKYHGISYIATLLSHLLSTLLALFFVYNEDISKKIIKYSFYYFVFFYVLNIIYVIPRSYNVNFVWEFEGFHVFPFYTKLYLFYVVIFSILPGYYIQVVVKKVFGNNKQFDEFSSDNLSNK